MLTATSWREDLGKRGFRTSGFELGACLQSTIGDKLATLLHRQRTSQGETISIGVHDKAIYKLRCTSFTHYQDQEILKS